MIIVVGKLGEMQKSELKLAIGLEHDLREINLVRLIFSEKWCNF